MFCRRTSAAPAPPTATSRAARGATAARTWSARSWPLLPPSPATSLTCASSTSPTLSNAEMMPYMRDRVGNPKWWVGLLGITIQGVAAFVRLRYGGSPTTLLVGLIGLGLLCIWLVESFRRKPAVYGLLRK